MTASPSRGDPRGTDVRRVPDPFDHLPIAAYVDEVDADGSVRLTHSSSRYEELTGIAPDELAKDAWSWDDRVHPDDQADYFASFEQLWRGHQDQDVTYRLQRPDGSWVWLHDRASAVHDDERGVTVICGFLVDVTQRREAELEAARVRSDLEEMVAARTGELEATLARLRQNEVSLERAQALLHAGSFDWDAASGELHGSAGLARIYGVPFERRSDIDALLDRVHPDDRAGMLAALERLAAGQDCPHLGHRIVRDAETREIEVDFVVTTGADGAVQRVHGSAQDVTERRRAERETARRTEMLRLLAGISARFVAQAARDLDEAIEVALGDIGRFVGVDRAYVFLVDAGADTVSNAHEWCAHGITPVRSRLQDLPKAAYAWWMERLDADETIKVDDVALLPPSAAAERTSLERQGVRSVLVAPMRTTDRVLGYLGLDAVARPRSWTDDTVFLLRTVADTLAGALQRVEIESALRRSEANYRTLADTSVDMLVVTDVAGTIVHANPAAKAMLGRVAGVVGAPLTSLYDDEVRDEVLATTALVLAGTRAVNSQPVIRADGGSVPVETRLWRGDWNGEPCVFSASRDLSREQEALQRFDRLFHRSPALMAVNKLPDLGFVDVNDAFLETLGYDRHEVIGRRLDELRLFTEQPDLAGLSRRLWESGGVRGIELQLRTKRGRVLDGLFSAEPVEGHDGHYLLTVMVDVTAQKQAERQIKLLNRQLKRRVESRTAELETANRDLRGFVDSVAHDLRGPLRTIGSFGQILQMDHADDLGEDGRDAVGRIVRANARMGRLIDALLDLSGLVHRPLHLAPVDLTEVATAVLEELQEEDPSRQVEWIVQEGMRAVIDPDLARILYDNLLGNAWKFTRPRETAHITAGCDDHRGDDVFFVRDDGVGFDAAYASRLFQAFERLHRESEFPGVGIGLATVERIVRRHGGRVWADGVPDAGATFSFTLTDRTRTSASGPAPGRAGGESLSPKRRAP